MALNNQKRNKMQTDNHKTEGVAPVGSSAVLDHTVNIEVSGKLVWQRRNENGQPGGITARSKPLLENVVAILNEALAQAKGELYCLDDSHRMPNRSGTAPQI
jgi:hypothetical protein